MFGNLVSCQRKPLGQADESRQGSDAVADQIRDHFDDRKIAIKGSLVHEKDKVSYPSSENADALTAGWALGRLNLEWNKSAVRTEEDENTSS